MKTFLKKILVAFSALIGLVAYGQAKAVSKTAEPKSLLWKISGNGLSSPSYLYGTIHITCDATLDKATINALNNTAQLYLELDLDDKNLQMEMVQGMLMKDGKTMKSMVSEADYKLLDTFLKDKLKMGADMVNNMKPAMISTLLMPLLMDCPIQSVEGELMKINASNNKETLGLEAVKDQLAIFDAIPYQVQMDELMKAVKAGFDDNKKELGEMYAVYQSKDVDALQKLTEESDSKLTADYQNVMLDDRNANWIPKIETIAKTKPTFFGVGAAHLGGPKGVISLLKKKGYIVEPVVN